MSIFENQNDKEAVTSDAKKKELSKLPRSFMSPAYVEEQERGMFAMYRDILVETDQPDGIGGFMREKLGKRVGPMMILRKAAPDEEVDFTTSRSDGSVILLTRIFPPKEQNPDDKK